MSKHIKFLQQNSNSHNLVGKKIKINNAFFIVEKFIAEGRNSLVFLVRDVNSSGNCGAACFPGQTAFAMKRMLVNNSNDYNSCFSEINILKSINHKNVLPYLSHHVERLENNVTEIRLLTPFYSMSLTDELRNRQRQGGRFEEHELLRLVCELCEALSCLHFSCQPALSHRDVKTENVLIDFAGRGGGRGGRFVLCDFGSCSESIALPNSAQDRAALEEAIRSQTTAAYRAPELLNLQSGGGGGGGESTPPLVVSPACDIWALGCVVYRAAFFRLPFGENPISLEPNKLEIFQDSPRNCSSFVNAAGNNCQIYSRQFIALLKYIWRIPASQRPDVFQVAQLAIQLGSPARHTTNPIPNKHGRTVPNLQELAVLASSFASDNSSSSSNRIPSHHHQHQRTNSQPTNPISANTSSNTSSSISSNTVVDRLHHHHQRQPLHRHSNSMIAAPNCVIGSSSSSNNTLPRPRPRCAPPQVQQHAAANTADCATRDDATQVGGDLITFDSSNASSNHDGGGDDSILRMFDPQMSRRKKEAAVMTSPPCNPAPLPPLQPVIAASPHIQSHQINQYYATEENTKSGGNAFASSSSKLNWATF